MSISEVEDEWKTGLPRKGKLHAKRPVYKSSEEGLLSYRPGHSPNSILSPWDAEKEHKLRQSLQKSMERVRRSVFYKKLVEQMQRLQILETLVANARRSERLRHDQTIVNEFLAAVQSLGPNPADYETCTFHFSDGSLILETVEYRVKENHVVDMKPAPSSPTVVELVVLGVGSILDSEVSRCQMSLALLLKNQFACIGDLFVFDPVLSAMEYGFLSSLGCTPILRDEKGRRRAYSPTLFYMPHCGAALYNNLLEANMDPWCLGWISILGNSFRKYQDSWEVVQKPMHARPDCLLGLQKYVTEHSVNAALFPCVSAFNDMSWHLFPIKKYFY